MTYLLVPSSARRRRGGGSLGRYFHMHSTVNWYYCLYTGENTTKNTTLCNYKSRRQWSNNIIFCFISQGGVTWLGPTWFARCGVTHAKIHALPLPLPPRSAYHSYSFILFHVCIALSLSPFILTFYILKGICKVFISGPATKTSPRPPRWVAPWTLQSFLIRLVNYSLKNEILFKLFINVNCFVILYNYN